MASKRVQRLISLLDEVVSIENCRTEEGRDEVDALLRHLIEQCMDIRHTVTSLMSDEDLPTA